MAGTFILVVGPSGSGKGVLLKHLKEHQTAFPDLVFPVSCTTREIRPGEKEGETYYYLSREEFQERIDRGDFLEWAEYGGNRYGTLKSEILEPLAAGKTVVREVEVQGARSIIDLVPEEQLEVVFIYAGSWDNLRERIVGRAPISEDELAKRQSRYEDELSFKERADYVVENPNGALEEAKARFLEIVHELSAR